MDHLPLPPHDIAVRRQQLFDLNDLPLRLSRQEFDLLWPMVDNIYSIRNKFESPCDGHTTHYVICRFKRFTAPTNMSLNPTAKRRKRLESTCNVAFKILEYPDHYEFQANAKGPITHTHTLEESDANKRHSFLIGLAKADIARGHRPAQILRAMRGEEAEFASSHSPLRLIGGTFLTRQDIINCGNSRRVSNPNALFVDLATNGNAIPQADEATATLERIRLLHARTGERLEQIRARFFEISEYSDRLEPDEKVKVMQRWEDRLAEATNALIGLPLEDFVRDA